MVKQIHPSKSKNDTLSVKKLHLESWVKGNLKLKSPCGELLKFQKVNIRIAFSRNIHNV